MTALLRISAVLLCLLAFALLGRGTEACGPSGTGGNKMGFGPMGKGNAAMSKPMGGAGFGKGMGGGMYGKSFGGMAGKPGMGGPGFGKPAMGAKAGMGMKNTGAGTRVKGK